MWVKLKTIICISSFIHLKTNKDNAITKATDVSNASTSDFKAPKCFYKYKIYSDIRKTIILKNIINCNDNFV